MDLRTASLATMSLDEIHRLTRRGQIRLPNFHRGGRWTAEDACSFLNQSFTTMIFEPLIFSVDVDHLIDCIDGWRRLQAISGDPGLWYDFASGKFYDRKQGSQSLDLISVVEKGPQGCISELSLNNAGAVNAKAIESVAAFFRRWESHNIPVFRVLSEPGTELEVFEELNRSGLALWSCTCDQRPLKAPLQPFNIPTTGNRRIISSSIHTTNHKRFFGLDDVDCAIHTVDKNTVNNLMRHDTHQTQANIETLIRHARNCAERMAADQDESRARSLVDRVEKDIHKTRQLWEHFENTDCVSDQASEDLESALATLSGWANECRFQDEQKPLPTIPVRFDGCFLPEKKTVCGEEFLPGIYISD